MSTDNIVEVSIDYDCGEIMDDDAFDRSGRMDMSQNVRLTFSINGREIFDAEDERIYVTWLGQEEDPSDDYKEIITEPDFSPEFHSRFTEQFDKLSSKNLDGDEGIKFANNFANFLYHEVGEDKFTLDEFIGKLNNENRNFAMCLIATANVCAMMGKDADKLGRVNYIFMLACADMFRVKSLEREMFK